MCVVHCPSMTSSTIVVATVDMTEKLGITLPRSIIQKIDQRRGRTSCYTTLVRILYDLS